MSSFLLITALSLLCSSQAQITSAPPAIVVHPPAYSTAVAGQTVRLTCAAYGVPTPNIYWSKASGNITAMMQDSNSGVRGYWQTLTVNGTDFAVSVLEICGVGAVHTDEYSCWADNGVSGVGIAASTAKFFLSISIAPSEPPAIVVHPPNATSVDYGSTIEAVCVAYGNPIPSISWTKSGCSNISASGYARVYNEIVTYNDVSFRKSVLQLCNVKENDTDSYSCSATNGVNGEGLAPNNWPWSLSVSPSPSPSPPPPLSSIMPSIMPTSNSSMMMTTMTSSMISSMSTSTSTSMSMPGTSMSMSATSTCMPASPTQTLGTTSGILSNEASLYVAVIILEAIFVIILLLALVIATVLAIKFNRQYREKVGRIDIPNAPNDPRVRLGVENPLHALSGESEYEIGGSMSYKELVKKVEETEKDRAALLD